MPSLFAYFCRHRDTWLISGGSHEWCYRCGALRQTWESGIAQVTPRSPWCRPVGEHAPNPWAAWNKRRRAYLARRQKP